MSACVLLGARVLCDQALRQMWEEACDDSHDGGRKRSLSSFSEAFCRPDALFVSLCLLYNLKSLLSFYTGSYESMT